MEFVDAKTDTSDKKLNFSEFLMNRKMTYSERFGNKNEAKGAGATEDSKRKKL